MTTDRIAWVLYLVGSLLVFASWVDFVPAGLGWIGWLMALGGWASSSTGRRRSDDAHTAPSTADQIEMLDSLRRRAVITDDEFEQEKRRLLGHKS